MNKEIDHKKRFLDWAENHLASIGELNLASGDNDNGLRAIKKTAVLSLLETLAVAFETKNPPDNRKPFARLVEDRASWPDAKRVSAFHLLKAIALHLQSGPGERKKWEPLQAYLKKEFAWILDDDDHSDERKISDDPCISEIIKVWPGDPKNLQLKAENTLGIWDFKHSYLLYKYRNCLVHESREPNFSYEDKTDIESLYMIVHYSIKDGGKNQDRIEYHLVYPLHFLINLTKNCIDNLRKPAVQYDRPRFGSYIIPELNSPQPRMPQDS